ncbi:SDR family NAD(P)-dependent oxidoreductase [Edaphobacillus lindanitolerans]|uniref:NAD(P)-dependent dehydrogenase, short-chain alcohol dehydrogenase family n=1 Tax=Edaphobacillus lindanitolerans TaxID=550447 RepID=A0A1U7PLJ8_9BACI|nr:SDR family oxidoreductase [Edaphobacillus lindanitolerans]SIT87951.1 NAD(P)-dependent dehydrogenase, short-chain alcohol dehydrogenase family [Edaphobacillus lindanitolerans]
MTGRLEGKAAVITGAAGGIGRGMALAFAKEGAKVAIVDINEELGNETQKELQSYSPDSFFIKGNLMDRENLGNLIEEAVSRFGKLDILVNNAHASTQKPFIETTQKDLDLSFGTGFYPTFCLMQAAYPHLKQSRGSIINFASGAGLNGQVNQVAYAAAKEAIRGITRVAANEWGQDGININLISPIANSPGIQQWKEHEPEAYDAMISRIPMRRLGELEGDIGRVAVFLASDDASYITGQTIMVDGGATMLR